jgi:hypothetical protein
VYVVIALCEELFAMMGLLVPNRAAYEQLSPTTPILPAFMRRALAALFRRH